MALAGNVDSDFRYLFDVLKLPKTSRPAQEMRPIYQLAEQWRSPDILEIWSKIFARQAVAGLGMTATRYRAGHFLTQHDDGQDPMRLAAFTLSLSSGWREEWGGLLHLTDENGGIERTFVPEFNSLVLFNVPRNHFVSEVASTAPGPRLTISGWLLREPE
jgi:SM-20-related protein